MSDDDRFDDARERIEELREETRQYLADELGGDPADYRHGVDELPDETEKDDRLFTIDSPGGVDIPAGVNIATWDGAVEIQTHGDTQLSVRGPFKIHDDQDDPHIRLTAIVDDAEHDTAASDVSMALTVSDAQVLANLLGELRHAEPEVLLSEDSDADADGDSA